MTDTVSFASDSQSRTARTFRVKQSATIDAEASRLYGIIADYRAGHPSILPEPWFSNLVVDEGGVGEGTRFHFDVRAFGQSQTLECIVTEPAPGRALVETYPATGVVTTFSVVPRAGSGSEVTIDSLIPWRPGFGGLIERLTFPPFLRRLFATELRNLARVAAGGTP